MKYIERAITPYLQKAISQFPAVLVTGPRQVGKSTLLRHIAKDYEYLTFDDPMLLEQAKRDPALFLLDHPGRLFLDEVQYVPELFPLIKIRIDEKRWENLQEGKENKAWFLLSGSENYQMMSRVTESLAGRIAILPLLGLSMREISGIQEAAPFLPSREYLLKREKNHPQDKGRLNAENIWDAIHRGGMPGLSGNTVDWNLYFSSYVKTYIERDVHNITKIESSVDFVRFMAAVASRSGELLNYQNIAHDVGVSSETIKRWIDVLETSGLVFLLKPYLNNHLRRVTKTSKLYFTDTGLMAWLTKWLTPDSIKNGAKAGQFFETFVVTEILKSWINSGEQTQSLFFYRDSNQKEIDLVIEYDRTVYPIEIKMTASPDISMAKAFSLLEPVAQASNLQLGNGIIINRYDKKMHLKENLISVPVSYL